MLWAIRLVYQMCLQYVSAIESESESESILYDPRHLNTIIQLHIFKNKNHGSGRLLLRLVNSHCHRSHLAVAVLLNYNQQVCDGVQMSQ